MPRKNLETPELDKKQTEDLVDHLRGLSTPDLRKALDQTIKDATLDQGPYPEGGMPANTNRTFCHIQQILGERTANKNPGEEKG
ncbi:hypothetical protein ACFL0Y_03725 [Patescibacteria group bacterium]